MTEIPFLRAELPPIATWIPILQEAYARHHFTNFGILEREFATRCRDLYAAPGYDVVTVTNATCGMTAVLMGLGIVGRVVMPAFTFPATLQAIVMARCTPVVLDIDRKYWELDLLQTERALAGGDVAAVVTVRPYGFVRDQGQLAALCQRYGCPLLIDAAAAFGHPGRRGAIGSSSGEIEVISLHATKTFAVGEGGLVFAPAGHAATIRGVTNFAFDVDRNFGDGGNMKLDEIRAAIGLAMLEQIDGIVARRAAIAHTYHRTFVPHAAAGLVLLPSDVGATAWQCFPVRCRDTALRDHLASDLAAAGIGTRAYYSPNASEGYRGGAGMIEPAVPSEANFLSAQVLCLPLYPGLTDREVATIMDALDDSLARAETCHAANVPAVQ